MEKLHRSKNDHIYTTTFVPEHALPNKEPNALDPFLEPLITELEELFIDGKSTFEAYYKLYYTTFCCFVIEIQFNCKIIMKITSTNITHLAVYYTLPPSSGENIVLPKV